MQIYIHREGQQFGPYSFEQTRDYLASGNLLPGDLAWHEGSANWVPLDQMEEVMRPVPKAAEKVWIPPRRGDASEPVARVVAPKAVVAAPEQVPTSVTIPVSHAPVGQAAPVAASGKAPRTPRRSFGPVEQLRRAKRSAGLKNMGMGGVICVVGAAVTAVTYEEATSSPGGGQYFVAWGAIVFGGIQFLRGLIQFCTA